MNNNNEVKETRYCKNKNCGCELPSSHKGKYCDKCSRERAGVVRKSLAVVGSVALVVASVIPGVKHFVKK